MFGTEKLLRTVDRRLLDDIGKFAAAVISLARVALGILASDTKFSDAINSSPSVCRRTSPSIALLTNGSTSETFAVKKLFMVLTDII
jgi:hypothetical protein